MNIHSIVYFFIFLSLPFSLLSCSFDKSYRAKFNKNQCVIDMLEQGTSTKLYGLDCIKDKKINIKTNSTGKRELLSNSKNGLKIEEDPDFISHFYNLNYELLDRKNSFLKDLLEDHDFYGVKNTKYQFLFNIDGKHLIIYKFSKDLKNIPHIERTSLEGGEQEGYQVPYLFYPIEYCKAWPVKNKRKRNSPIYQALCKDSYKEIKNLQIRRHEHKSVKPKVYISIKKPWPYFTESNILEKKDLFPAEYFIGKDPTHPTEWYYAEEVFEEKPGGWVEYIHNRSGYANIIKWHRTANHLEARNYNSPETPEKDRKILLNLPVEWKSYEKDTKNLKEISSNLSFKDKAYLLLKPPGNGYIESFVVAPDYFSFILVARDISNTELKVRHSFLKKSSVDSKGFIERTWNRRDSEKYFGFFSTEEAGNTVEDLLDTSVRTQDDRDAIHKIQMLHLGENPIEFHISKESSEDPEIIALVEHAISVYNQSFQYISGNKNKDFVVLKKFRKNKGDIRYNIINIIYNKRKEYSNFIGYGPSYFNPRTGQVISTLSDINVDEKIDYFAYKVTVYIRHEIYRKNQEVVHSASSYIKNQIEKKCPEVSSFIKRKKALYESGQLKPHENLSQEENSTWLFGNSKISSGIVLDCAKEIAKPSIIRTILHELGHNFGLRHNFKCSADSKNYWKSKAELLEVYSEHTLHSDWTPAETSCVMDYPDPNHGELIVLGKYDLAALRYAYFNQLELNNGSFQSLKPKQTVTELNQAHSLKKYFFCTDEFKRRDNILENSLCLAFDHGSNHEQITKNEILYLKQMENRKKYSYDFQERFRKLDNPKAPPALSGYTFIIQKLLGIYNHWWKLYEQSIGLDNKSHLRYNVYDHISTKKNCGMENPECESSILKKQYKLTAQPKNFIEEKSEYMSLYKASISLLKYFQDQLFKESMKCIVFENKPSFIEKLQDLNFTPLLYSHKNCQIKNCYYEIDLEDIKRNIAYNVREEDWYVEDCYSETITTALKKEGLTVIGQKGSLDAKSYFHPNRDEEINAMPLNYFVKAFTKLKLDSSDPSLPTLENNTLFDFIVDSFAKNPILLDNLRTHLEEKIIGNNQLLSQTDLQQLNILRKILMEAITKNFAISESSTIVENGESKKIEAKEIEGETFYYFFLDSYSTFPLNPSQFFNNALENFFEYQENLNPILNHKKSYLKNLFTKHLIHVIDRFSTDTAFEWSYKEQKEPTLINIPEGKKFVATNLKSLTINSKFLEKNREKLFQSAVSKDDSKDILDLTIKSAGEFIKDHPIDSLMRFYFLVLKDIMPQSVFQSLIIEDFFTLLLKNTKISHLFGENDISDQKDHLEAVVYIIKKNSHWKIAVPYRKDNFAYKLILKYRETRHQKEILKCAEKTHNSFINQIHCASLERFEKYLEETIETHIH